MEKNKTMDMNWLFEDLQEWEIECDLFYLALYIPIVRKIWELENSGLNIRLEIPKEILDKIEDMSRSLTIPEIFCVCEIIDLDPVKLFKGEYKLLSKKKKGKTWVN